MIATFYEWKIRPGEEERFHAGWSEATEVFAGLGSLGSSLWRSDAGHLCAFALWPDRQTRAAAFATEQGQGFLRTLGPLVEEIVQAVELDPLEMRWKRDALA